MNGVIGLQLFLLQFGDDVPQKEDSSFILRFRKIWNKIVKPKILFARETYHLVFYDRRGNVQWKIGRTVWKGAIVTDLAVLFGSHWPGFIELPLKDGDKRGIILTKPEHLGHYLLYKTKFKGPINPNDLLTQRK